MPYPVPDFTATEEDKKRDLELDFCQQPFANKENGLLVPGQQAS